MIDAPSISGIRHHPRQQAGGHVGIGSTRLGIDPREGVLSGVKFFSSSFVRAGEGVGRTRYTLFRQLEQSASSSPHPSLFVIGRPSPTPSCRSRIIRPTIFLLCSNETLFDLFLPGQFPPQN